MFLYRKSIYIPIQGLFNQSTPLRAFCAAYPECIGVAASSLMGLATGSTSHDFSPPGRQMRFQGNLKVAVARNAEALVQTTDKQTKLKKKKTKSMGEVLSGFVRMNTAWFVFSGSFLHHRHGADEKRRGRRHF